MSFKATILNSLNTSRRFLNGLKRPSKNHNLKLLLDREETLDSFTIRDATANDIPKLAALHVQTWNETYFGSGPSVSIRENQWREIFKTSNNDWFILVVENNSKEFIGFAYGKTYGHGDLPQYGGELNKIYLLKNYQRIGLGRKLFKHVVAKFMNIGITTMVLFGTPQNPSSHFHEAMGGKRLTDENEVFQGGYSWSDLRKLI